MQVDSATNPWQQRGDEQELQQMCCGVDDHRVRFRDGVIEVLTVGRVTTAKVIWDQGYGERSLERGPYAFVHAQIGEILRHGPSFGPVHVPDRELLEFFAFASDRSFRATRPHGELRIKSFLDQSVLLFVPDGGFRLLYVSDEPATLVRLAETYGAVWASLAGPRYAVRYQGKHCELRVSNLASELAFYEVDAQTRFSLRAHSLPVGEDIPAMAVLELVRDGHATRLALVPFGPDAKEVVIWSEEQSRPSPAPPSPPPPEGRSVASTSAGSGTSGTSPAGGSVHPAVWALLERYVRWFAEQPGAAQCWRREIAALLRAAERGTNVAGWGVALRRALERAGGFDVNSGPRAFCYWVKDLRDGGILVRPCGKRRSEFVFAELRELNSLAVARLCAWAGVTLESLLDNDAGAASSPPPPEARENAAPPGRPSTPSPRSTEPPPTSTPTWPSSSSAAGTPTTEPAKTPPPTGTPSARSATIPSSLSNWPGAGTNAMVEEDQLRAAGSIPQPSPRPMDPFDDGEDVMGAPDFLFLKRRRPHGEADEEDAGDGSARGPPDEEPDPGEPDGS